LDVYLDPKTERMLGMSAGQVGIVQAVYELREAAVEHGKALAAVDAHPSAEARDALLETQIDLERKTVIAVDECSESD
jgi:hypothetical protein